MDTLKRLRIRPYVIFSVLIVDNTAVSLRIWGLLLSDYNERGFPHILEFSPVIYAFCISTLCFVLVDLKETEKLGCFRFSLVFPFLLKKPIAATLF